MRPVFEKFLLQRRELKRRLDARNVMSNRLHHLVTAVRKHMGLFPKPVPHSIDLTESQDVRLLVSLHSNTYLSSDTFADLLPRLIEEWVSQRKATLTKLLDIPSPSNVDASHPRPCTYPATRAHSSTLSALERASAVFYCSLCEATLRWDEAVCHRCLYDNDQFWVDKTSRWPQWLDGHLPEIRDLYANARLYEHRGIGLWSTDRLKPCYDTACRVVEACGFSPISATPRDLDNSTVRLACRLCSQADRKLVTMGWRTAVRLYMNWITIGFHSLLDLSYAQGACRFRFWLRRLGCTQLRAGEQSQDTGDGAA